MMKGSTDAEIIEGLEKRASARRDELARSWLKADEVNIMLGSAAGCSDQLATLLRRKGQLLGAWWSTDRTYRYPPWQFRPDGQPAEQVAEILRLLREERGMKSADRPTSGWNEMEWFLCPHVLLDGSSPSEVMAANPERVLEIAIAQFVEDSDAGGF